ncbi:ABC transporter substrate-binding protein [Deinococcus yavapaiensis]|uniref:Peptide/nickel transport system substrate-binding protein n=1 Tax=Deinococcus yavapaiensis KR-236 TaxID=694435 RepID=A0A318S2S4_9DEIO|nr:ABC transporter substrate-binding protein [Deinococcus yavapaiensis]PYE50387.1 peptide/nickel transport system substrate-binding protein [Deinococcus yavapaiensis KR-236]
MKKHLAATAICALLSLAAAETLVIGLNQDPPQLDPALATATSEYHVLRQMFDTLVGYDQKMRPIPAIAKSWKISPDGLTYTFNLRTGVKFHDGTNLDATAVKFSLDRNMTMDTSAQKGVLSTVKDVKVVNPTTVQITLKNTYSPLLAALGDVAGMIVSPTAAKKAGDKFTNQPVGSGPFSFVSRVTQDNITLEANKTYWNGAPKIDKLQFKPFPDGTVRMANLLSNAVQVILPVEPKDVEALKTNAKFKYMQLPTLGFRTIVFNTTRAPFNNKALREAVSATFDRAALSKVVFFNTEQPTGGPFAPGTAAYSTTIKVPKANLATAKQKLSSAQQPNLTFTLLTIARAPEDKMTQVLQAMAAQAGINMKIEQVEVGQYLQRVEKHDFDAVTMQWSGKADPDGNIYEFFLTNAYWNWSGYSDKSVDALLNQARNATSMADRRKAYTEALKKITADKPTEWLLQQSARVGMASNVDGVKVFPDGILRLKDVTVK